MRRFACALFALVLLASSARAQHGDAFFQEKLDRIETAILEKSASAVEEILGKPGLIDEKRTDGTWYYNFKIEPQDVTRIVGFSVSIRNDHVVAVRPIMSYTELLDSHLLEIGTFAGAQGKKAAQRDILVSFDSYLKPKNLSKENRLIVLEAVLAKTGRAEEQKEPLVLPADCLIVMFITAIFEELSLPSPKRGERNEQGVDLKEIKGDIARAIKMLKEHQGQN